jgi:hypothetical protein
MRIVGLVIAALVVLFGFRLLTIAWQTGMRGRVLVRQGFRYRWEAIPSDQALKRALRDGFMGLLLIVLGVVMMLP